MSESNQEPKQTQAKSQLFEPSETHISLADFLQNTPPSRTSYISDLVVKKSQFQGGPTLHLHTPDLKLTCTHLDCGGVRTFRCTSGDTGFLNKVSLDIFVSYMCSNCDQTSKKFSLNVVRNGSDGGGACYKYGEFPAFGPQTPTRLLRLLDGDRDLFLKGRRCETQGLGIGAFTYYRRVVENRKDEIFLEILRVAKRTSVDTELIKDLEAAKKEISFSKAVEKIKHGFPESLTINGHNPLTLLHTALSVGLHDQNDTQCLELAQDIRNVLVELAEKVTNALKDEAELTASVNRLRKAAQENKKHK